MKIRKFFGKIEMFFRRIRWFYQRGKRGYADCDLWNFDLYLAKLLKNGLNDFADMTISWPDSLYETHDEWIQSIKDAAALTDYFDTDNLIDWDKDITHEDFTEAWEQSEIAIHAFFDWMKIHFTALWD